METTSKEQQIIKTLTARVESLEQELQKCLGDQGESYMDIYDKYDPMLLEETRRFISITDIKNYLSLMRWSFSCYAGSENFDQMEPEQRIEETDNYQEIVEFLHRLDVIVSLRKNEREIKGI